MSKPRQVLQISPDYSAPFLYLCGQYARMMKRSGYQVTTVYLVGEPNEIAQQQSESDEVIFLNLRSTRGLKLSAIYSIFKLYLKHRFEFFLCQRHQSVYIATHIPGAKVVAVIHGPEDYKRLGRRLWLYWHKKKIRMLAVSNELRNILRQRLAHFPAQNIQTLHNSIDPPTMSDEFIPRAQAQQLLGLDDHFWFVQIARLSSEKDQTTLIQAFAKIAPKLPNARLAIMGGGPMKETLHALAVNEKINDKIVFLGNITNGYRYLLAFDAFVLSSLREGCPMVLLEAMLAGLPIIATDLPTLTEVLADKAWRFTPKDATQLSLHMQTIYTMNHEARRVCYARMQERVLEHFSTQSMTQAFWALRFFQPHVLQIVNDHEGPFLQLSGQYAAFLKASGYKVTTVYFQEAKSERAILQSQADELLFLNLKPGFCLKLITILTLVKLHLKHRFVFCIAHRYLATQLATYIPGLKIIGVLHGYESFHRFNRLKWTWHKNRLALLGVSDAVRDALRKAMPKFPAQNIQTLHNSVDPQTLQKHFILRAKARQDLKLGDYFWFVHIGRLVPEKDQATLIRSFAQASNQMPNARLAIIGSGHLKESLETLTVNEKITDKVLFFGNIVDAYYYLPGFDAFVLSSIKEGLPMVLLESMVAGLPIIASDLACITEAVGDTAWRFKAQNADQLAQQMKVIYKLTDHELKNCQEKMYQRIIDCYSTDSMRKQFWQIMNAQGRNRTGTGD